VCRMLPLASSSGPAFILVVVTAAALLALWLLRSETRDEEAAKAEPHDRQEVEPQDAGTAERQAQAPAVAHRAEQDRLSEP
jgi:hypothetical protein